MLSAILSLAAPAVFSSVPALAALGLPSFAASAIGSGLGALLGVVKAMKHYKRQH